MPVDRRPVGVVLGQGAELEDGVAMIAAATTAKTAMQMIVVNQNVNSIRSISSEAEVGSQGTRTATSDARAPARTP